MVECHTPAVPPETLELPGGKNQQHSPASVELPDKISQYEAQEIARFCHFFPPLSIPLRPHIQNSKKDRERGTPWLDSKILARALRLSFAKIFLEICLERLIQDLIGRRVVEGHRGMHDGFEGRLFRSPGC